MYSLVFLALLFYFTTCDDLDIESRYTGAGQRIAGKLNVHLVPHTHDDVGWLKTVDQYFYGANNSIQHAGVQYILDTVIPHLVENPNRKFIYVEQAFFQRWWAEQDEEAQKTVQQLVTKGQLEFINGGWCMHDEAGTHYVAMIDQTTLGHRLIKQQFGVVPKIGWQIDPFGHSSTQASLLSARVGFQGLFFARIDYQDSQVRNANKEFEMIWRPSPSLGLKGQIFTGAFERNGYGPPRSFNWDADSGDAPIQDDPRLEDYNVQERIDGFVNSVMDQFSANQGDDIMLTLGSDFQYSNAHTWFKNLDKLIYFLTKDGRVNAFYSTPSAYVAAKMASNITWTVKTDDFFPYADCQHCYWTGYFTSRPALKRYVRINSAYLNLAWQVEALMGYDGTQTESLAEALGVAQHHDAVSGTSKQHVAYDYAFRLARGAALAGEMLNTAFSKLTSKTGPAATFSQCTLLNETICEATQKYNAFSVVVYNALSHARTELVRLPVTGPTAYTVYDATGAVVPSQTLPSFTPFPKEKPASYALYFLAKASAAGFNTYFVQPSASESISIPKEVKIGAVAPVSIENSAVKVDFSATTGRLSTITNKKTGLTTQINQDFLWYNSAFGTGDFQNSGAYIFRPNSTDAYEGCSGIPQFQIITGSVVNEIRYKLCDWLAQTVRLTGDESFVEFEYHVGSIPIGDGLGKEVISRFSSDVQTANLYYTDSNGREFQTRKKNFRPTWPLQVNEPVAGNYYPVNAAAYIKDAKKQISFLNDRSQGGASLNDGQFELMIHRRLLKDDRRGVSEPLNETDGITDYPNPVRLGSGLHIIGSHYILLDEPASALSHLRTLQSRVFSPLVLAFSPMATGVDAVKQWISSHTLYGSALVKDLPANVELLTLHALGGGQYLLRLSHQYGVGEDATLSQPVTVDLSMLFSSLKIATIKEVSLTTVQDVADMEPPFQWPVKGDNANQNMDLFDSIPFDGLSVTINPMDIRTFIFTVA